MTAIIVLDVETTGKDRSRDQIIEICIQLGLDPLDEFRGWRIRPTVPIHAEATAVHGISAGDLEACPAFAEVAPQIIALLAAADVIVGYNVAFDIDMLQAELARAGLAPIDLATKQVVDVLRLWHHVEPRTLAAAHEKFCGAPMVNAHQAAADVAATAHVLRGMIAHWGIQPGVAHQPENWNWPELATIANPFAGRDKWIGPSHHIQWNDAGHAVFAFGKNSGQRIDAVDPGFLRWVLGKDFPSHVQDICHLALHKRGAELLDTLAQRYPRKTTTTEAA